MKVEIDLYEFYKIGFCEASRIYDLIIQVYALNVGFLVFLILEI